MFKIFKYLFEFFFIVSEPIIERVPEKLMGVFFYALLVSGVVMVTAVEVTQFSEAETIAEMVYLSAKCVAYFAFFLFFAFLNWIVCFQEWSDEGVVQ